MWEQVGFTILVLVRPYSTVYIRAVSPGSVVHSNCDQFLLVVYLRVELVIILDDHAAIEGQDRLHVATITLLDPYIHFFPFSVQILPVVLSLFYTI